MRDISIDIEALGSGANAALTQIGACWRADVPGGLITFRVDVLDDTGTYDAKAMQWHRKQDGYALPGPDAVPLDEALGRLSDWLLRAGAKKRGEGLLWTHATYDIPRLAEAYARLEWLKPPWVWPNCRDLRTLYDLAGGRPNVESPKTHDALDDAIRQLEEIEACRRRLERGAGGE